MHSPPSPPPPPPAASCFPLRPCCCCCRFFFRFLIPSTEQRLRTSRRTTTWMNRMIIFMLLSTVMTRRCLSLLSPLAPEKGHHVSNWVFNKILASSTPKNDRRNSGGTLQQKFNLIYLYHYKSPCQS